MRKVFDEDFDVDRIIKDLSLILNVKVNPKKDLIFFDEIQECPKALHALKYFCEDKPELAIIAAGSLLGVTLSEESFPVGKVTFLNLYPMNFEEFLLAINEDDEEMAQIISKFNINKTTKISNIVHQKIWELLLDYYIVGGLPEAVKMYVEEKNKKNHNGYLAARNIHKTLIKSYGNDFAKHTGKLNASHIVEVFHNIPLQLAKNLDGSVQRYIFKNAIKGKNIFHDIIGPIDWLTRANLIIKTRICNKSAIPLESFCKDNIFKLYFFDIGLLTSILDIPLDAILKNDYGISKGFFAENFVAQELKAINPEHSYYGWNEGDSEIEFLTYDHGKIIPIEVKSGIRTRAKSLGVFMDRYKPPYAIKLSALNLHEDFYQNKTMVKNIPLYLASKVYSS
ncbi:MAG: ATP-binding protein [Oligoflexia bacterium]|nr:ATP-binding protein [Oligoflexia bacterium]